jgi:hypothetical protein
MSRPSNAHSLFSNPAFSALEVESGESTEEEELPEELEERFVQHRLSANAFKIHEW